MTMFFRRREFNFIINLAWREKIIWYILIFSFLFILSQSAVPIFIKELIKKIKETGKMTEIFFLSFFIIFFFSLTRVFYFLSDYTTSILKIKTKKYLREIIFKSLLKSGFLHYSSQEKKGKVITTFNQDVEIVGDNSPLFPALFSSLVELILSIIILLYLSPFLTIIVILTFPLYTLIQKKFKPLLESSSEKERKSYDPLNKEIKDILDGLLTIKIFKPFKFFEERISNITNVWGKKAMEKGLFYWAYWSLTSYIENVLPFIILCIGAIASLKGIVNIENVIAVFAFVGRVFTPIWNLNFLITTVPGSYPSVKRIMEIILLKEEKIKIYYETIPQEFFIKLENISFKYPNEHFYTIKNLNLALKSSERFIGIVGENGSGKTTLLLLIAGVLNPDEGKITFNKNFINFSKVFYVMNKDFIFHDSILNNILLGEEINKNDLERAIRVCKIYEFSNSLGEIATELSEGQKQRIALARVLCRLPDLILLDEATAPLDPEVEENILKSIKFEYPKLYVILVSHRLNTLSITDRIYFIKNGEIKDQGTLSELLLRNEYFRTLPKLK